MREDAAQIAIDGGARMYKMWICHIDGRERTSHRELNDKAVMADEDFKDKLAKPGDPRAPAGEVINCRCTIVYHTLLEDEELVDGVVVKRGRLANTEKQTLKNEKKNDIIRPMANGGRQSRLIALSGEDIQSLKSDIAAIGADPSVFVFNEGYQTGYSQTMNIIFVRGDVMPSNDDSPIARDRMSQRAVLAHEYYGHMKNIDKGYEAGSWQDQYIASFFAAKNAPNLTHKDRMYLMQDALDRARQVGEKGEYDAEILEWIYGYEK